MFSWHNSSTLKINTENAATSCRNLLREVKKTCGDFFTLVLSGERESNF